MAASRFEQTTTYQDLLSMQMWADRRIAAAKRSAKPDPGRLKKLLLEQEAVRLAKRALDQHGA